jgi:outer membrane protein assembly factor BamE (lipoprotein component of BamABCDE complex)
MGIRSGFWRAGLGALVLTAGLAACTPLYRDHGYVPLESELAAVSIGTDTRETVLQLLGPPTAGGVLNEGGAYYVSSRFRHYGLLAPREIEREVVAVSFDPAGRVSNIERFGLQDGRVVVLSRRVTDDNVSDSTFIRQLLGSIGRVDPTTFFGD